MSPDPAAIRPGDLLNFGRYVYADANPVNYVDPDGRTGVHTNKYANAGSGVGTSGTVYVTATTFYSGSAPPRSSAGVSWSNGGSGSAGGGGATSVPRTEPTVVVTADRPPDGDVIVGASPIPVYADTYIRSLMSMLVVNGSIGFGASGQFLGSFVGGDAGFAADTQGNLCAYGNVTQGLGVGLPVWGAAGVVGAIGTGALATGTQTSKGLWWAGGTGLFGEGQIMRPDGGGGVSYARGILGVSGSPEGAAGGAGGLKAITTYRCL